MTKEEWTNALIQRFSKETYKKLFKAKVTILGLGGLGSNIAIMLVKSGINNLTLIDYDKVELTNINRQAYTYEDIGEYKTDALTNILKQINPFINLKINNLKITEKNAYSLLNNSEIICEAFDDAQTKAMIVNYVLEKLPNKKIIASSGMGGYENSNLIKTKKITNNFYICGDEKCAKEDGYELMSPRVNICAGHQANMVIRLILEENTG